MHMIARCFDKIQRSNFLSLLAFFSVSWIIFHLSYRPSPSLPNYTNQAPSSLVKPLPDFSNHQNVNDKKNAFFEYLLPIISNENAHLQALRTSLESLNRKLHEKQPNVLHPDELSWIKGLADHYKVDASEDMSQVLNELLMRIDSVPASLVLAQAAIESGWGTSRFAKKGNNLFGHWCFKKGCGLIPSKRSEKDQHEVARFPDINSSVRAYLKNLNSFSAYQEFRKLRRSLSLTKDTGPKSLKLLVGLSKYSEQGQAYLEKVRRVILANSLAKFDH